MPYKNSLSNYKLLYHFLIQAKWRRSIHRKSPESKIKLLTNRKNVLFILLI